MSLPNTEETKTSTCNDEISEIIMSSSSSSSNDNNSQQYCCYYWWEKKLVIFISVFLCIVFIWMATTTSVQQRGDQDNNIHWYVYYGLSLFVPILFLLRRYFLTRNIVFTVGLLLLVLISITLIIWSMIYIIMIHINSQCWTAPKDGDGTTEGTDDVDEDNETKCKTNEELVMELIGVCFGLSSAIYHLIIIFIQIRKFSRVQQQRRRQQQEEDENINIKSSRSFTSGIAEEDKKDNISYIHP